MATEKHLTIQDLLDQQSLGLAVVVSGVLATRVRGAHTVEIEHPGRWLKPGWLMLTTGLRFVGVADSSAAQRELMAELAEARIAGLLFGVGVPFREVPRGLVTAARDHEIALLTIPAEVPFFKVEDFVNQTLLSSDAYLLKRQLWLQNDLLHALSEDQPVAALVARLGHLIKGTAVLYEESGRIVASTGEGPTRLIWAEIASRRSGQQRFAVGRWQVAARPVVLRGTGYWIAVGSRSATILDDVAAALLDTSQRLLAAIRGARALSLSQERADAAQLLVILRDGVRPERAAGTWERLRGFRFQAHQQVRAICALPGMTREKPVHVDDVLDKLLESAHLSGLPLMIRVEEKPGSFLQLTGIAGDSAALEAWAAELSKTHVVGLSEPFGDLIEAPTKFRDAEMAVQVARRRNAFADASSPEPNGSGDLGVVRFEDVDLATWLLSSRAVDAVRAKTHQRLGALLDKADLVETVVTYFACDLDIRRTGRALCLHPNSVRYRLRRCEEILDASLSSTALIANLHLALHDRIAETASALPPEGE